ncbi:MAG: tetratricopeptide repeat protein [FCB group bacterium]|nr:tetratricopeptide repeat protein [FCB group bacterium]
MTKILDMNIHGVEEIPGKLMELNGAQYIFQELLGEGGEKFVYPIKNKKSGLILYIAKILKSKPGSPRAEESISSLPWKLFALVIPKLILYTEIHEIPGAIIHLQPYGVQENPEYCRELMDAAFEFQKKQQWVKAANAFDAVFKSNPNHSMAMLNKAVSLINQGDVESAIGLIQSSISIEPNYPEAYRLLSSISLQLGHPEAAIATLMRTLDRFNCDAETWEALLNIAIDYDLVEVAQHALEEVGQLGTRPSGEFPMPFVHFKDSLKQSISRRKEYDDLLIKALSAQMNNSWEEALAFCDRALSISKNNGLAVLNHFVCKYHLGKGGDIADDLISNLPRWNNVELASAVALGVLCSHLANMPERSKRLALWIAEEYSNHVDIPAVPVGIADQSRILEARSSKPILDVIDYIEEICTEKEAEQIAHLKALYIKREKEFSK